MIKFVDVLSQADFLKNGTVVFTGAVMAGFVGILTGMSKSGFSLSINERDLGGNPILDGFNALLRKAWSPSHLARQVHACMALRVLKEVEVSTSI